MIALLSTLIYRGDVRMEKEFKNGDIVRVTDDKRSLKCVSKDVKAGDKGIIVGDGYEDIRLVDFGSCSFYVTIKEIELITNN